MPTKIDVVILIILISILLLIILLLLIPVRVNIDSMHHVYQVKWSNFLRANLLFKNEEPIIRINIFFWKKEINLLKIQPNSKKEKKEKKEKKPKTKSTFNFRKKYKRLLKSIQVKQFFVNIDTGNYIWNAYLYPLFFLLKNKKRRLHINYQGNVEVLLEIQSRPIQILYALVF